MCDTALLYKPYNTYLLAALQRLGCLAAINMDTSQLLASSQLQQHTVHWHPTLALQHKVVAFNGHNALYPKFAYLLAAL